MIKRMFWNTFVSKWAAITTMKYVFLRWNILGLKYIKRNWNTFRKNPQWSQHWMTLTFVDLILSKGVVMKAMKSSCASSPRAHWHAPGPCLAAPVSLADGTVTVPGRWCSTALANLHAHLRIVPILIVVDVVEDMLAAKVQGLWGDVLTREVLLPPHHGLGCEKLLNYFFYRWNDIYINIWFNFNGFQPISTAINYWSPFFFIVYMTYM